eukprot:GHVO01006278.1.p1 GENE.GHVO01006278.1~~GHVO01006278.1.p1  ORF type:complete len:683 (+),score=123.10 GHVO01006278.1:21-2069(+)
MRQPWHPPKLPPNKHPPPQTQFELICEPSRFRPTSVRIQTWPAFVNTPVAAGGARESESGRDFSSDDEETVNACTKVIRDYIDDRDARIERQGDSDSDEAEEEEEEEASGGQKVIGKLDAHEDAPSSVVSSVKADRITRGKGKGTLGHDIPALTNIYQTDERRDIEMMDTAKPRARATSSSTPPAFPDIASWFSKDKIDEREKKQLSGFFESTRRSIGADASSNDIEHRYMKLRNWIVDRYLMDPRKYLTMTECRRCFSGDAALLLRLHSFLEYWGLINFTADPATVPSIETRRLRDFRLADANYPGGKWASSRPPPSDSGPAPARQSHSPVKCVACGKLCLYTYYVLHPGTLQGISAGVIDRCAWCLKCHANGKYPSCVSHGQFVKVDLPAALTDSGSLLSNSWTPEQASRLLDAVEMYAEDWTSIAEHVGGGKTAQECVEFFIQLPITDTLESANAKKKSITRVDDLVKSLFNPPQQAEGPFASFANPLMAELAFIASAVHPVVAAAAAKAAAHKLRELQGADMDERVAPQPAHIESACATALAAAAVRAKELTDLHDSEIRSLSEKLVETRLRQLEVRLEQYDLCREVAQMCHLRCEDTVGDSRMTGRNTPMHIPQDPLPTHDQSRGFDTTAAEYPDLDMTRDRDMGMPGRDHLMTYEESHLCGTIDAQMSGGCVDPSG